LLALLYDVHGNPPALEAVLLDAEEAGATTYLVGGDLVAFGPDPFAALERLRSLSAARFLRGNTDRWLLETPVDLPAFIWRALDETRRVLRWEEIEWLYSLPTRVELDGVLYVHASPLVDTDSFAREPQPEDERRLAGVSGRTVVFGHSHVQFGPRAGPDGTTLLNPGSVGQPLDGDPRAAYALVDGDAFDLRRVEYDHIVAANALRALGSWAEPFAKRIDEARA
jgi:diadenosine tetraphosphatase ApaH/serine/threonine PP2A family protein phosphatase